MHAQGRQSNARACMSALQREHQVAVMLQRSLLPRRPPEVAGVSIAARYLPARDEVGGDWYDMIELPRGAIGVAIGDVVGHGLDAAMLMGQLRTALHAYASEGHGPAKTLELVDRFATSLGEAAMASVAYAVLDSETGQIQFASAGHLPPVIFSEDGSARVLEVSAAPPIGAFSYQGCPEHEVSLRQGETMLMYTDGLIERPRVHLSESMDELIQAVRGAATAEEACLLAMDRMVPLRGPRDDVAVLALQNDAIPEVLELTLPADPAMLSYLRRLLTRWLRERDVEREVATEITIAAGEAAANAIEHAYGPGEGSFEVQAQCLEGTVHVSVADHGHWRPPRGENRGRGLTIMEAAMDDLDVTTDADGTKIMMRRRV